MPEHTDTPKEKILVYIRAEKQKTLHRRQVCINDIASVYCKYSRYEGQIKGIIVDKIRGKKSVISVMKIIEQITESYDDAQVISIGEPEVLVEYDDNSKNKILEALKVAAVCILIFFGSAFTIMAFNNDISISGVFEHFYKQISHRCRCLRCFTALVWRSESYCFLIISESVSYPTMSHRFRWRWISIIKIRGTQ